MWNESSVPWWVCFYSNSHLMVKIMLHAKYEPFEKAVFNNSSLNSTVYLSEDDINKIVNYAKQFADN